MTAFRGIALKLVSTFCFTVLALLVRYLGQKFPAGEIAFVRAFFGLIGTLLFYAWRNEFVSTFRTKRLGGHIVRVSIAAISTFFFIGAYARLPVVDVTAITFLAPLITVALSALFLKERVHIYRWTAVGVGFAGVLVMLAPYLGVSSRVMTASMLVGAILALLNAFGAAGATIQVRRLSETEATAAIVTYFSICVALASLLTLPFGWRMPETNTEIIALLGLGVMGGTGQILLTSAYRYAPPSLLATFEYSTMIWAFLLGYLVFGEVPTVFVVIGSVIVTGAGLSVIWRERQLGLERLRAATAVEPAGAIEGALRKP